MATLAANMLTLLDITKRLDPDGKVAMIGELLNQRNPIIQDIPWEETNDTNGHRITVRTGLPTPTWRLLNNGVAPTKSTTAQITEACAILEDWIEVDEDVAKIGGQVERNRFVELQAHVEGMNQEFASTLIYGNGSTAPEEFTGLALRYNDLSADNASHILDAGGTGSDNTSIWLVNWGDMSCFGIYPKGTTAGLIHNNYGLETVETTAAVAGNRMRAYRERLQWKCGLALKDWRFIVRIANIDVSNLVGVTSAADIQEWMIKATHVIESLEVGRPAFYMNRTVFQMLDILRRNDVISGGGLTFEMVDGVRRASFRGVPIRVTDALLETEARIT